MDENEEMLFLAVSLVACLDGLMEDPQFRELRARRAHLDKIFLRWPRRMDRTNSTADFPLFVADFWSTTMQPY